MSLSSMLVFTAANATKVISGSMISRTDMMLKCADGFQFNAEENCCIQEYSEEPEYTCSGLGRFVQGECICVTDALETCPANTRRTHHGCVSMIDDTPMVNCDHLNETFVPSGTEFGYCIGIKAVPAASRCPDGYFRHGDRCRKKVVIEDALVADKCPNGWEAVEGLNKCVRAEIVDCVDGQKDESIIEVVEEPDVEVDEEQLQQADEEHRKLCDKCGPIIIYDACSIATCEKRVRKQKAKKKDKTLLERSSKENEVCLEEALIDAKVRCKDGKLWKDECWVYDEIDLEMYCHHSEKSTLVTDGEATLCQFEALKRGVFECEDPSMKLKCAHGDCLCRKRELSEFELQCPQNYSLNNLGDCERRQPAVPYCPNDESLYSEEYNECVGIQRSNVVYEYTVTYREEDECEHTNCIKELKRQKRSKNDDQIVVVVEPDTNSE